MAKKRRAPITKKMRFKSVKWNLDNALAGALALKDDLEYEVDELDRKNRKKKYPKNYYKFVVAIDQLDKIVGHLVEADDVRVKL